MVIDFWYVLHLCWSSDDILRSSWILSIRQCNNAVHSRIHRCAMAIFTTSNDAFEISRSGVDSRFKSLGAMHKLHLSDCGNWWLQQQARFHLWNRSKGLCSENFYYWFSRIILLFFYFKVVLSPLSWQTDIVAVAMISAFILALLLLFMFVFCWCSKSHHRHVQRLQRRNSIRQSLRSLNAIDPQGSLRRRNYVGFGFYEIYFWMLIF